jgi:hypothetical protein
MRRASEFSPPVSCVIPLDPYAFRLRAALTVRAGNHHDITVSIAEPKLPVLGGRIDVRLKDNLGTQRASSLHDQIEIVHLEPQYDTMPRRSGVCVDEVGMVLFVPSMKLKK